VERGSDWRNEISRSHPAEVETAPFRLDAAEDLGTVTLSDVQFFISCRFFDAVQNSLI